jgi:uncharacterized membrane protein
MSANYIALIVIVIILVVTLVFCFRAAIRTEIEQQDNDLFEHIEIHKERLDKRRRPNLANTSVLLPDDEKK